MSDGCLALVSTVVFKPVDEEGSCPFTLSTVPLTSSPLSRAEEKLRADDSRHRNVILLFSAVEGCARKKNTPCKHTRMHFDGRFPACASARSVRGVVVFFGFFFGFFRVGWGREDGVRSCLVWSGPGHSRSVWASGNVWREIRLCLKRSSRCSYITGCLVVPQIKPQRSSCRRAAPHTDAHSQGR